MTRARFRAALAAAVSFALLSPVAYSLPGGGGDDEGNEQESAPKEAEVDEGKQAYDRGMELVKEGRYQEALDRFREAAKRDKRNYEYLNMVAYTLRKTGDLDDAFETYQKVLSMKPNYAPAREYLGEAHIQAALLQLDVLRGYGEGGKPQYDALLAALREASTTLQAEPMGGKTPVPDKKGW